MKALTYKVQGSFSPDELVTLVKDDEVDIHSISVYKLITEWIKTIENRENLDEFFNIFNAVTYLLSLKLLTLLPTSGEQEEVDEIETGPDEEIDRDWIYTLRDELKEKELYASKIFSRPFLSGEKTLEAVDPDVLFKIAQDVLSKYRERPAIQWEKESVDIKVRRIEIEREIKEKGRINLKSMLERENSLLKVIIVFVIVLELCKQTKIRLLQRKAFGGIWVVWRE